MRGLGVLVVVLAAAFVCAAGAGPAWAHARLVESSPAGGDVLARAPGEVRLHFDKPVNFEQVEDAAPSPLDPVKVYGEDGERMDGSDTRLDPDDPRVLLTGLKELPNGVYGVDWTVTAKDGHMIDGALGFTVDRSQEKRAEGGSNEDAAATGTPLAAIAVSLALVGAAGLAAFAAIQRRKHPRI